MKIVEPAFEILEQENEYTLESVLKHIERVGRVCYKSEDKITGDSYKKFVAMLENNGHGAMLEHGTVYLMEADALPFDFSANKYSKYIKHKHSFVTTNYRVIVENGLKDRIEPYISKKENSHERWVSVKFTCDRGVSHEFVRNRGRYGNAFAQESTRYCDYNKGNGVVFCRPVWLEDKDFIDFENSLYLIEHQYNDWREKGWQPQQARGFLNHFLKTELIITGMMSDWEHFFSLRADSHAHPSAQQLAYPLKEEFIKRGWLET